MKAALYARVSTRDKEQNPDIQLDALRDYCRREGWEIFGEYVDYASALDIPGRGQWARLMKDAALRKFDELLVWRLDRAFRDNGHASSTMSLLRSYGIGFRSISDLPMDIKGPMGEFLFTVWVAVAQLERATMVERIKRGLEYARQHGTKSGHPIGRKKLDIDFTIICKAVKQALRDGGEANYTQAAKIVEEMTDQKVSPGFVFMRLQREAESLGKTKKQLLKEIIEEGGRDETDIGRATRS